jgi:hypothetical protein
MIEMQAEQDDKFAAIGKTDELQPHMVDCAGAICDKGLNRQRRAHTRFALGPLEGDIVL